MNTYRYVEISAITWSTAHSYSVQSDTRCTRSSRAKFGSPVNSINQLQNTQRQQYESVPGSTRR